MSTKAVASASIALLCVTLALYFSPSTDVGAPTTEQDNATRDESSLALPTDVPPGTSSTLDADQGARANDAPPRTGEAQALLPQQIPPTPMTQSLEELRLPPVPEILETERLFATERVDPLSSTGTEAQILSHIAQMTGLQLETLHVECRTSLCRLQLSQRELPHGAQPAAAGARPGPRSLDFVELVGELGLEPRWVMSVVDRTGNPPP